MTVALGVRRETTVKPPAAATVKGGLTAEADLLVGPDRVKMDNFPRMPIGFAVAGGVEGGES